METLEGIIRAQILSHGPMDVGRFMGLVLGHPQLGYYITRDPLGAAGDFVTAPEISQLFGEMIGLCLADHWLRAGGGPFHLVEFGPGRGTLMADLLRAAQNVPGFHAALTLHLVETSQVLREKQKAALTGFTPTWHDDADTLPQGAPLYMIANEFFDALPIRQAVMTAKGWAERVIGLEGDRLAFGLRAFPAPFPPAPEGTLIEFSPARDAVTDDLCRRLKDQGGLLLVIDYGHDTPDARGDTLQALYRHNFCPPLEHAGDADLTSHVDFYQMKTLAAKTGCHAFGSVTQKDFLEALGIKLRLKMLNAPALESGVQRLLDPGGMGALFRVLGVSASPLSPAGLDNPPGIKAACGPGLHTP